jgi:hypothetical protein
VVTGEEATDPAGEEPVSLFAGLDKPVVVYVCDMAGGCEGFDKLEEVVFKNEKVALGLKAFRTVKMDSANVESDPLLKDEGTEVPRLLVVDPVKEKVTVLEKGKLKANTLFSALKSTSARYYEENLDKVVKDHLKLLTERDQVSNELKVLQDKEGRSADDADKLAKLKEERAEVEKRLEEFKQREVDLWKLTPKERSA